MSSVTTPPPTDAHQKTAFRQAMMLGLVAAALFSLSFVLNRRMALEDGHWTWSAALRFLLMLPVLAGLITWRGQWGLVRQMWRASPSGWFLWGMLGCGVFYAALTAACTFSPGWLVAATWMVSIVLGILIGPLFYRDHRSRLPKGSLAFSGLILAGVFLLQAEHFGAGENATPQLLIGLALTLLSAAAHPAGNRGSMLILERAGLPSDPLLRLFLLIIGSLPLWLALCVWGAAVAGPPSAGQLGTVAVVAATGLLATPFFYGASDRVSHDPAKLAAVESTQAAEIVFAMLFEAVLIDIRPPDALGWLGLVLLFGGFILHARPVKTATPTSPSA